MTFTSSPARAPQGVDDIVIDETKARNNNLGRRPLKPFGNKEYRIVGTLLTGVRIAREDDLAALQDALEVKEVHVYFRQTSESEQLVEMERRSTLRYQQPSAYGEVFTSIEKNIPIWTFLRPRCLSRNCQRARCDAGDVHSHNRAHA